jgi:microcystin-dependent protein
MFDERSENYNLPLPQRLNPLNIDVDRLRDAINTLDAVLKNIADDASADIPVSRVTGLADALIAAVPTGSVFDWALNTAPSGYLLCDGAVLDSNTPYTRLRDALIDDGFPHGQDGSGNPKLPDARGRVTAGKDNMGGAAAGRLTATGGGIDGKVLGNAGGVDAHAITTAQMPVHNHGVSDPGHGHGVSDPGHGHGVNDPSHAHSVYDPGHNHSIYANYYNLGAQGSGTVTPYCGAGQVVSTANIAAGTGIGIYGAYTGISIARSGAGISIVGAGTGISTQNNGSGAAHPNVQPTLVLNKIIKT